MTNIKQITWIGCWQGVVAGFWGSVLATVIAIGAYIASTSGDLEVHEVHIGFLLIVLGVATVVGILPSMMIGALVGTLIALIFWFVQRRLTNAVVAGLTGVLLGLALATPMLAGWLALLLSQGHGLPRQPMFFLWMMGPCALAGAYTGYRLHLVLSRAAVDDYAPVASK